MALELTSSVLRKLEIAENNNTVIVDVRDFEGQDIFENVGGFTIQEGSLVIMRHGVPFSVHAVYAPGTWIRAVIED